MVSQSVRVKVPLVSPMSRPPIKMTIRHSWYQSPTIVYIDMFAKNIDPAQVHATLKGSKLCITIQGESVNFDLSHECSTVTFKVYSVKVSFELKKSASEEWKSLQIDTANTGNTSSVYPTSARKPLHLDSLNEADDQSNDVQDFFKKLYAQADEDTRRAMLKSMSESGGTVLSTNWADVGSRTVDRRPPTSD